MHSIDNEDLILRTLQSTFARAVNLKIIKKSMGGDSLNITSEIVNLTVEYEENNKSNVKHLTLKIPAGKSLKNSINVKLNIFRREAYTYEKVLPYINKLFDADITPIHYNTTDSNILVLENMAEKGYKSASGTEFLNEKQFPPLLKTLAKFHAASFKVHQQHPYLFTDNIFKDNRLATELQPYTDEWIPVISEILKLSDASYLIPKVKAVWSTITHENGIKRKILSKNFKFVVFNHGDYRRENLLIKYNNDQQATDIKIIDFQFCMWSTPVLDFLYCMITSVQTDLIDEHFDSFVNLYVQYLQETLLRLGCNETYDKTDFMTDFEKIKLSMNVALLSLCCVLQGSINRGNQDTDRNLLNKIPYSECSEDEDFVRIVSYWFKYFEKIGALDASYAETTESPINPSE